MLGNFLKNLIILGSDRTTIDATFATKEEAVAAANGIKGRVATYSALIAVDPADRDVGMWIVDNDENTLPAGHGSMYSNNQVTYTK